MERTIEGEFALEVPSLSTLALDDDIDEEKEEIESQLPQTVGEGDVPRPRQAITDAMAGIAALLKATADYEIVAEDNKNSLDSVFLRVDVSAILTEVIDRLASPHPVTSKVVPVREDKDTSFLQSVFHRSMVSVEMAEVLDRVKEQAEREERKEYRRTTRRRLLSRLGAVYAERRLDSLAVVGRHSYIPGLWSLERDDVVVTTRCDSWTVYQPRRTMRIAYSHSNVNFWLAR